MGRSRQEKKAELMQAAEGLIDELLDWDEQAEAPTLTEIENVILKLRQQMGQQMAEEVLRGQEARTPVPGPVCPTCQREMRYRGSKHKEVESLLGAVELERGYYYCDHCQSGLFSPG
jgi:uncharacterized protein with PIN domain